MPIPAVIHQTWKTLKIPQWAQKWHRSWKKYNPTYIHVLWSDKDNFSFIKTYYPQFLSLYKQFPVKIQKVDFVRYLLLYHYGGIYADLDFECFKPLDVFLPYSLVLSKSSNMNYITNSIMMSEPRHPFWIVLCNEIAQAEPRKWYETEGMYVLRSTGPVMINRIAKKVFHKPYASAVKILQPNYFFPFSMWKKNKYQDLAKHDFPKAFGCHHHQCTWSTEQSKIIPLVILVISGFIMLILYMLQHRR